MVDERKFHLIKPILRPLTVEELMKERKGNEPIIIELLKTNCFNKNNLSKEQIESYAISFSDRYFINYSDMDIYLKYHLDVDDLIGQKLAINMNDL